MLYYLLEHTALMTATTLSLALILSRAEREEYNLV
jgi:hypothetical protein